MAWYGLAMFGFAWFVCLLGSTTSTCGWVAKLLEELGLTLTSGQLGLEAELGNIGWLVCIFTA